MTTARKQAKDKANRAKKKAESEKEMFVTAENTRISHKFRLSD